jgi:glycosyltransferase involved in cell wall biosynthesis
LNNPKVSILIANYNNAEFIEECIYSLKKQTYKNIEIIFFDDFSKDNSISIIKKFTKVKVIQNTKKTTIGSFNQIKAYEEAFKISEGEIIFFLDSDDFFHQNKVEEIVKYFNDNKKAKIVFNYPLIKNNKEITVLKRKKKIFKRLWPFIHSQSCISIKRKDFENVLKVLNTKLYPDIWLDFRIIIYSKYILKEMHILDKNLTYYRQLDTNISSKFKFLSNEWWKRRLQAHEYLKFFLNKHNMKYKNNLDYFVTKIYNFFIK